MTHLPSVPSRPLSILDMAVAQTFWLESDLSLNAFSPDPGQDGTPHGGFLEDASSPFPIVDWSPDRGDNMNSVKVMHQQLIDPAWPDGELLKPQSLWTTTTAAQRSMAWAYTPMNNTYIKFFARPHGDTPLG